ncbi:MAG: hypothetical protein MK179_05335 [Pirellulaceae bacterium]|nr:hypothetical protein [Pirellulaceae bacterium]
MRDHATWSVSLGRWAGIRVRLHVFFLLFAAFTFYLGWRADFGTNGSGYAGVAALSLGILSLSVLLHALTHCHLALRLGANVDQILLGPFGEMGPVQHVHIAPRDLAVAVAGPLSNACICLFSLPFLIYLMGGDYVQMTGLLSPLHPVGVDQGMTFLLSLKLLFWINWILFLVNIVPVFPLDGGWALRAILLIFMPGLSPSVATYRVARVAQVIAFALIVAAYVFRESGPMYPIPTWFSLVVLGIFLFFAAQHEIEQSEDDNAPEDVFEYDFSQGYTSLDRSVDSAPARRPGPMTRWLAQRRLQREQQKQQQEVDEERRMDEILTRLHEVGSEGLSADDRRLLDRVSQRYRSRMDQ